MSVKLLEQCLPRLSVRFMPAGTSSIVKYVGIPQLIHFPQNSLCCDPRLPLLSKPDSQGLWLSLQCWRMERFHYWILSHPGRCQPPQAILLLWVKHRRTYSVTVGESQAKNDVLEIKLLALGSLLTSSWVHSMMSGLLRKISLHSTWEENSGFLDSSKKKNKNTFWYNHCFNHAPSYTHTQPHSHMCLTTPTFTQTYHKPPRLLS